MIPIALDPAALPVAIAGRGALALRRFQALRAAGAGAVLLFSDLPDAELADAAGEFWRDALPKPNDLAALKVLWIVRLSDDAAADLAALARSHRVLVNVEDRPALCDFHSVAEVRRGSLLLTVSTGGASPGLAARIRAQLARQYGPEWAERTAQIRRMREAWRRDDYAPAEISSMTDVVLRANSWLA
jgi:precorrin-2 dehydrogenase/sirohydrochlorin ferrochelatase